MISAHPLLGKAGYRNKIEKTTIPPQYYMVYLQGSIYCITADNTAAEENRMANQLVWKDEFNIGVEIIDNEHKKLFSILNRMFSYKTDDAKRQWVCQEGIKYFKDHAMKHFTDEEQYMASIDYIGFETHRHVHDNFRQKTLPALEKELARSAFSTDAIDHFLGVCAGWLLGHTLTEDHAITGKTTSQWGELLPEEQQADVRQIIIQILSNMFRLKARVVSDCYSGEKFGDALYYRLAYASEQGKRWEVILAFEEKMLFNTIGAMINSESDELSVMLINVARYMAQQFVQRVREQYPSSERYEMKEEKLLSNEQFRKNFAKERPQTSLLLDTGQGYFACCMIAPHLFEYAVEGTTIRADNAMVEIRNYIKENEAGHKKKILVVDDSEVVQKALNDLLGKDYEVTLVNSGIAAIRRITLDRPDLVLLDYEMPVCNGSQLLEMIRSEQDLADLPVIFLTGNLSKEYVENVIPLKPAGYLVKTLKPEEIRQIIDDYFKG